MADDETLEADNPFSQAQLESGDSLNYTSNFWNEAEKKPSFTHQQSAYDNVEDSAYQDRSNAYDDEQVQNENKKTKKNAITNLFNNLKKQNPSSNNDNAYQPQNDIISNDYYAIENDDQQNIDNSNTKPPGQASSHINKSQVNLSHDELDQREEALQRKEKQLTERKKRLDAVKHELNATNIRRDNWPCSYYPILFHSITQEIPPYARGHMKKMYFLVLCTFLIFVLNTLTELILYFSSAVDDTEILLAVLYLFCGVIGAWRLWYRQIYYGIRDVKTVKWWCFFFFFGCHIGFCSVMFLGIKSWGGAGIIIMINAFGKSKSSFAGFCALVCSIIWLFIAIASTFYLKKSWVLYRQRGGIEQAQGEFANAVAQHATDQLV